MSMIYLEICYLAKRIQLSHPDTKRQRARQTVLSEVHAMYTDIGRIDAETMRIFAREISPKPMMNTIGRSELAAFDLIVPALPRNALRKIGPFSWEIKNFNKRMLLWPGS